jgi:hypothetical protein
MDNKIASNNYSIKGKPELTSTNYIKFYKNTLQIPYNPFMPLADLAQINLGLFKFLPGNLMVDLKTKAEIA